MPSGVYREAAVAGPPSPEKPYWPLPAIVVISPDGDTLRTTLFPVSAMYRFPTESTATPSGLLRDAAVAGPRSPEKPNNPLPAAVAITPSGDTFRILAFRWSAI